MTLNKNKSALAESHNDFAFIASSLLVAYDEKDPANMDVRIIDFDQSWKIDTRNSSSEDQQSIDKFNQMFNKGLHDFKKLIMNVSTAN